MDESENWIHPSHCPPDRSICPNKNRLTRLGETAACAAGGNGRYLPRFHPRRQRRKRRFTHLLAGSQPNRQPPLRHRQAKSPCRSLAISIRGARATAS